MVPFVLADQLRLPRDLYYGLYIAAVVTLFVAWARDTGEQLHRLFARRWPWALSLGLLFALISAFIALLVEDPAPHPSGIYLAAAVIWRGVLYGAADGLLLSAFPILVVFSAMRGRHGSEGRGNLVLTGVVALIASVAMTATYHLGYTDFRSSKLIRPVTGDLVWSIPTLATLNPAASPLAHVGLHVGAVIHSYDSDLFLPPHRPGPVGSDR